MQAGAGRGKARHAVFLQGACKISPFEAVLAQCGIRARRALSVGTCHALP